MGARPSSRERHVGVGTVVHRSAAERGSGVKIVLNREVEVPLRDQIVAQVELQILTGELRDGQRLPSVRQLASRLSVHPRTVHAAYRQLQANQNLELQRGSGAYVRRGCLRSPTAVAFEPLIRDLLGHALASGLSPEEVRAAVRRWLDAPPPRGAVVVDTCTSTAEIMATELRAQGLPSTARDLDGVLRDPAPLAGQLVVTLPFHADRLRDVVPHSQVVVVSVDASADHRAIVRDLPPTAIVLVVSHSPRVPPYARSILEGLRGHDVVVDSHPLEAVDDWQRVAGVADLVLADVVAAPQVSAFRPSTRLLRLMGKEAVATVRQGLAFPLLQVPPVRA
jgi:GntR family transcriptional regulator